MGVEIGQDDIRRRAGFQHAQPRRGEVEVGERAVVFHQQAHHRVAIHPAGVAVCQFVHEIGKAGFFPHRAGEAVGAQPHADAHAQHFFHPRRADGVVHVGTRLMRHPGTAFGQQRHFAGIHMHGVRHNGALAQNAVFCQPVHHPQAGAGKAVILIRFVFGHMDVEAHIGRAGFAGRLQRIVIQAQAGVEAKSSGQPLRGGVVVAFLLHGLSKADVFGNAFTRAGFAVAVGHLVSQHGAHAGAAHGLGDHIQRAGKGIGRGVVVKKGGRAVADGVHQHHLGRKPHGFLVQRLVQRPPEALQNFGEHLRRGAGDGHAPGKGAIKMGVRYNLAGEGPLATGIKAFLGGVAGFQRVAGADFGNHAVANEQRMVGEDAALVVPGHKGGVGDKHRSLQKSNHRFRRWAQFFL